MTLTQSHLVKSQHSSGKCAYISVIQPRSKVVKSLRTEIRLDSILSLHFFNASARTCYPHDLGATRWLHFSKNHPPHQDVFTLYHKSPILLRHVLFPRLDSCIMLPQDFKFLEPISVSTNLKYLIEVLIQFANALLPLSLFTFLLFLQKDLGRLLDSPNIFIGTNWSLAITSLLILVYWMSPKVSESANYRLLWYGITLIVVLLFDLTIMILEFNDDPATECVRTQVTLLILFLTTIFVNIKMFLWLKPDLRNNSSFT